MPVIASLGELLLWAALGALAGWVLYRPVAGLLVGAGAVRRNYAGREVPVAGGLVFMLAALAVGTLQWLAEALGRAGGDRITLHLALWTGLLGFCFLGLVDDLLGSRETGGFKGHFRLLLSEGRLTSGVVKAAGGLVVACWPAFAPVGGGTVTGGGWPRVIAEGLLNAVIIALSANAVNLLDLRPGRAFKGFVVLLAAAMAAGRIPHPVWVWLAPLAGAAVVFAGHDLRAQVMMGDTGANVLGAAVGLGVAWTGSLPVRLGWFGLLVLFHLYTERTSLSAQIERRAVLRWLDRLGRRQEQEAGRE